jgi:hypothetical protein
VPDADESTGKVLEMFCHGKRWALAIAAAGLIFAAGSFPHDDARAQGAAEIVITHKDRTFDPGQVTAPANKPFVLRIRNADGKAIEFESKTMRVEKIIAANSEATINVKALKPGSYEFFDEFNESTRGTLIAQ